MIEMTKARPPNHNQKALSTSSCVRSAAVSLLFATEFSLDEILLFLVSAKSSFPSLLLFS